MSFENFPGTEKTTEMPQPPKNGNWRNYLMIGLVVALLGTWAYIIWDKNKTKETIQQKETVIATTTSRPMIWRFICASALSSPVRLCA